MTTLSAYGPTDSALLQQLLASAYQGPTAAQLDAAPAALLAYLATPRTLEEVYPWGARRHYRPRMVRALVRQLIDAGQLATDDPAGPADWSWLWASTAAPPAPGARLDDDRTARLDKLTPKIPDLDWHQHHVAPEEPAPPSPEEPGETLRRRGVGEQNADGVTLEEVAKEMGVTRERVRQIEKRALEKLRARAPELFNHLTGGTAKAGKGRVCRPQRPAAPPRPTPPPRPVAKPASRPPQPQPEKATMPRPTPRPGIREKLAAFLSEPRTLDEIDAHLGYDGSSKHSSARAALKRAGATRLLDSRWVLRGAPAPLQGRKDVGDQNRARTLAALTDVPQSAAQVASTLKIAKSAAHRHLAALVAEGTAHRDPEYGYTLASAPRPAPAPAPRALAPVAHLPAPRPAPSPADRLAAARAAVAALSPEELDALLASLAPVLAAREALAAALASLRGAA